jgi:hypothetical protein
MNLLLAASLAGAALAAPPPFRNATLFWGFDAGFGDNMVLQRAPAAAAVYGYLDSPAATVKVTVYSNGAALYSVDATYNTTLQPFGDGWGVRPCLKAACPPYDMDTFTPFSIALPTWKAQLQPTPAGGNYTITAECTGCISTATLTISNAIFGDIWVVSAPFQPSRAHALSLSPARSRAHAHTHAHHTRTHTHASRTH